MHLINELAMSEEIDKEPKKVQPQAPASTTGSPAQATAATAQQPSIATTTEVQQSASPVGMNAANKLSDEILKKQREEAVAGSDRQIKTITDWMNAEENRPETDEERKKRERKERSKRIISAVGDGLSALSNLFFTTKYAPNMYNHQTMSQADKVNDRLEKLKAEREKKRDQYLNYSLRLGDLENSRARTLRELEAQREQQKQARDRHNWLALLQQDKRREQKAKGDKAEQDAIAAKAVADNAAALQKKKLETEGARGESYRASAGASRARAGYYGSASTEKRHHFRGKEYISEKDYTKDVVEAARQYNERHMDEVDVEKDDGNGGKKTVKEWRYKPGFKPIVIEREEETAYGRRTTARNPEEFAGEVEQRLKEEAASGQKMPGVK